jgi:hypothetical protein
LGQKLEVVTEHWLEEKSESELDERMEQTLVQAMEHWWEAKLGYELDYPMEQALA